MSKPTIYQACIDADLTIDHRESDLYVPDTPAARETLKPYRTLVPWARFTGSDGQAWIDIPFEYDPFWIAKSRDNGSSFGDGV